MESLGNIRDALIAVVSSINPDNGFKTLVDPAKVYKYFNANLIKNQADSTYPKVFVVADQGTREQAISGTKNQHLEYLVIFVGKLTKPKPTAEEVAKLAEDFVEDLDKAIDQHDTLNGTVQRAQMTVFAIDGGFTYPESVAVCHVEIEEECA
jgi:hypothetical protein